MLSVFNLRQFSSVMSMHREFVFMHGLFIFSLRKEESSEVYLDLSIMSVCFIVLLLKSRLLIVIFCWRPLGWIKNIGATFFVGVFDAFDVLFNVLLKKSKRRRSLGQNLKNLMEISKL